MPTTKTTDAASVPNDDWFTPPSERQLTLLKRMHLEANTVFPSEQHDVIGVVLQREPEDARGWSIMEASEAIELMIAVVPREPQRASMKQRNFVRSLKSRYLREKEPTMPEEELTLVVDDDGAPVPEDAWTVEQASDAISWLKSKLNWR